MTHERPDIAVLFVHGIGEQKRGATLAEFGGSLVDSARVWFGAEQVLDAPPDVQAGSGAPEHRELCVTRPGREPSRALLAESLWADKVHAPGWRTLMAWLFSTVPYVVQRAADAWMRRSSRKIDAMRMRRRARRIDPGVPRRSRRVLNFGDLLLAAVIGALRVAVNVAAVALTVGVLILLLALGALAGLAPVRKRLFGIDTRAFPVPLLVVAVVALGAIAFFMHDAQTLVRIGLGIVAVFPLVVLLSFSRRLRSIVVGFIGDSYALLHANGPKNEIVDQVCADLEWLEQRAAGGWVVIVAHSQGAEVVRRALCRRAPQAEPIAGLVTFGSGIVKLYSVGKLRGQQRRSLSAFGLRQVSAACAVLGAVALIGWWDAGLERWLGVALLGIAAVALTIARKQLQRIVGARFEPEALEIGARQVEHWTDLHASHDLVSEGDLPVRERTRGYSRTVVNRRSLILDHVTYPPNIEGFQAAIALELERVADGLAEARRPQALRAAERARTLRVTVFYAIRLGLAALVVSLSAVLEVTFAGGLAIAAAAALLYVAASKALQARAATRARSGGSTRMQLDARRGL